VVEAVKLVESGVVTPEDLDVACQLGFGHTSGPVGTTDLTGVDVLLHATRNIYTDTADEKFFPPELLQRMVTAGDLGRKSGKGFYPYALIASFPFRTWPGAHTGKGKGDSPCCGRYRCPRAGYHPWIRRKAPASGPAEHPCRGPTIGAGIVAALLGGWCHMVGVEPPPECDWWKLLFQIIFAVIAIASCPVSWAHAAPRSRY